MKKKYITIFTVLFTTLVLFTLFVQNSLKMQTLTSTNVPKDIETKSYCIFNDTNEISLYNDREDLVIVLAAMRPFSIEINHDITYVYEKEDTYKRLHELHVPKGNVTIQLNENTQQYATKAILTTEKKAQIGNTFSLAINLLVLGLNGAAALFSCILFLNKKSEKYLLILSMVAFITMVISFLTSSLNQLLTDSGYVAVQLIVNIITKPICSLAAAYLLIEKKNKNEQKIELYVHIGIIILLILSFVFNIDYCDFFSDILILINSIYLIAHSENDIWSILIGVSVSLLVTTSEYAALENIGLLLNTNASIYLYTPQFGWTFFVLCATGLVAQRFASKFEEADQLNEKLAEANSLLDEKVEERTKELTKQKEQKSIMMINIFHDLKSPLFGAMGCADMIEPKDQEERELLNILKERLQYVSNLTEQLFMMAKLENHKIIFNNEEIEMKSYMEKLCEAFELNAKEKNITIERNLKADIYCKIDIYRTKQALENIFQNAVKYSNENSKILISLDVKEGQGIISVQDYGKGIKTADLPYIFNRYYQSSYDSHARSTGLGLSIASQIIREEKGKIEVESEEGIGTKFSIFFPKIEK